MKLYYTPAVCSLAVRIAIHEMDLTCEFESVNINSKETETGTNFLEINPKGSVPALQLDNGELLTEAAIILHYLADTHKATHLLPPADDFARYRVLEWLNFIGTDVHKSCLPLFPFIPVPDDVRENIFKPILLRKLNYVNQQLSQHKYLNGATISIADFYFFTVLRWMPGMNVSLTDYPFIQSYFAQILERKAVQKALGEEGLL